MRTTAISQAFSVVGVLAIAGSAIYFCESITQPQSDATERRPRHAVTELTVAKENRSPQTNGDPPPEVTTVIVSSRAHAARWPKEALVVSSPQLVRQLQQELKRLGCYHHDINGEWTAVTRQAMKDFLERANAVLPLGTPEAVHLALLKGQAEPLCGTACPSGPLTSIRTRRNGSPNSAQCCDQPDAVLSNRMRSAS